MASLFKTGNLSAYRDRRFPGGQEEFEHALRTSTTVYIGNLSFYTTEEQIHELFSRTGEIKRIVMGLDKNTMTPCGFCFVVYYTRDTAEDAVKYISGTMLDDRPIRVDFDWGFQDGRQWGRGRSGGQVRDEHRTDYDPGRGGYGKLVQRELTDMQRMGVMALGMEGAMFGGFNGAPMVQVLPMAPMQHGGQGRSRQDRRDRRYRGGGDRGGGSREFRDGGRKRGRDYEEAGREGSMKVDESKEGRAESETQKSETQKNPRFRERGEDSDEEGDK